MGFTLTFGPNDDRELNGDTFEQLKTKVANSGFEIVVGENRFEVVTPSLESGHGWEAFEITPTGGYLSKPARDETAYQTQWGFLVEICELANWEISDPQSGAVIWPESNYVDPIEHAIDCLTAKSGDLVTALKILETSWVDQAELELIASALSLGFSEDVRLQAATSLRNIGSNARPTIDQVEDALSDPSPEVQAMAIHAIVHIGYTQEPTVRKIEALSSHPNESVMMTAKWALAEFGTGT